MEKLNMQTPNLVDENIEKIGRLFPDCLTERTGADGKTEQAIDFDKLRQELSKIIVDGDEERYQFTWPGKNRRLSRPMRQSTRRSARAGRRVSTLTIQRIFISRETTLTSLSFFVRTISARSR